MHKTPDTCARDERALPVKKSPRGEARITNRFEGRSARAEQHAVRRPDSRKANTERKQKVALTPRIPNRLT